MYFMVVVTWAWPASNCNALTFCVSLPARVRKVCRNACRPASLGKPSCFLVLDDVWWKQDKSGAEEVLAAEPQRAHALQALPRRRAHSLRGYVAGSSSVRPSHFAVRVRVTSRSQRPVALRYRPE